MGEEKRKDKDSAMETAVENEESTLDGSGLHDLYRHTTKLIK